MDALPQPMTLEELKASFKVARESIDQAKLIPFEHLKKYVGLLEWLCTPSGIESLYSQPDLKRFFFEEFVGGLAKRLSLVKLLDEQYQPTIYELCMLLARVFAGEITRDNADMADAMRYLLDQSAPLHQNLFQADLTSIDAAGILSGGEYIANTFTEEELKWRKELAAGSFVDCLKYDSERNQKLWCKGQVTEVKDGLIDVTFMHDELKTARTLFWYSLDLAAFDTQSAGDQWRLTLKEGDNIDALDSTRIWYSSTVVKVEWRTDPQNTIAPQYPMLQVGFRCYTPQGNREETDTKRKYNGWGSSFDEWIPAYSPRIMKFNSKGKSFDVSEAQIGTVLQETLDDTLDLATYKKDPSVFAAARKKQKSTLLVGILNYLGKQGVYQTILDRINLEGNDSLSIECMFYYIDSLSKCSFVFSKGFLNEYLSALLQAVKKKLFTSGEALYRNVRKERLDSLFTSLISTLLPRTMAFREREEVKHLIHLDIGVHLLSLNFLERRIDGAKFIQELSRSLTMLGFNSSTETVANNSTRAYQIEFVKQAVQIFKEKKIFFQIFSRERGHTQLVQRAEELLKLFLTQDQLSLAELELVWQSGKLDENTQLEIYKLFNELSSRLRLQEINYIIDQLEQVPLKKIILVQVQLVHEIAKRAVNGESDYGHRAIDYMWKLAIPSEDVEKVLINYAAIALTDIVKNWENSYKLPLLQRILNSLQANREGYLCIKMLFSLIKDFIGTPTVKVAEIPNSMEVDTVVRDKFENRSTFIEHIESEQGLMSAFFANFTHYMERVRTVVRQRVLSDSSTVIKDLSEKVLVDRFAHSDQMSERINFLKMLCQSSSLKLSRYHLSLLYTDLVSLSPFSSDTSLFFTFLKEICEMHAQSYPIVELADLSSFFDSYLLKDCDILQKLTGEGFAALQSYLMLVNEKAKRIQLLYTQQSIQAQTTGTYPPQKFTQISNTTGGTYQQFSFNENKDANPVSFDDLEFHIHVAPWELAGLQTIWGVVMDCQDSSVVLKATQLLIKLYTQVTFSLEGRLHEFEGAFIQHCFVGIQQMKETINQRVEPPTPIVTSTYNQYSSFTTTQQRVLPREERRIVKYFQLIKELISNSEKEGTRGVKSHASLFRGAYLDAIQLCNSLKTGPKYKNKHDVAVYSNTTVWELRKIIGERCARTGFKQDNSAEYTQERPCHPYSVRVFRAVGCCDIKEIDNGKTLAEIKFKRNEVITAYRKGYLSTIVVPLWNIDGTDLSDRARFIFTQWFNQCSEPKDPNDPESIRLMSHEGCQNFIRSATDEDAPVGDAQLLGMFEKYDYNQDGFIELEGFLNFWRESIKVKEDLVRINLQTYGYRSDLRRHPADGIDDDYFQVRPSKEHMPRFKIASDQFYFEMLFDLMGSSESEVSQQAWSLVKTVSTNPALYRKVLALDKDEDFKWKDVLDAHNIYKLLYSLQIIEALLEETSVVRNFDKNEEALSSEEDNLKRDWVERFLVLGGFQEILAIFKQSLQIISLRAADSMSKFEKNFLEQMLKMIKIFILAAYAVDEHGDKGDSVFDVIELVKQSSSTKEVPNESESKEDDQYRTPAKQVKGKFVQKMQDRRVQFNQVDEEITEDLLFGTQNYEEPDNAKGSSGTNGSKNIQSEKATDDVKQRYSALARIMRQCGLGGEILEKIDFKGLQVEALEVISIMLGKKEAGPDDSQIIENALSLWVATLLKNPNLINDFYSFTRDPGNVLFQPIRNAYDLIVSGVHSYKGQRVVGEFANSIMCLSQKVKNDCGVKPILHFIGVLRQNYPCTETYFLSRDCRQFFELFTNLIGEYLSQVQQPGIEPETVLAHSLIDPIEIIQELITNLKAHVPRETRNSVLEDKVQGGLMNVIEKLITLVRPFDAAKRVSSLVSETQLAEFLFYSHIFARPGSSLNECRSATKESRAAAYSLLLKCVESLDPKSLAEFLEGPLWQLLQNVQRPKKWKFIPADGQKASSFVGLVNLGCICYMNSMLQQFYMVPQFRYQLLQAEDESAADIKEHKGCQIDDRLLRQLQIMFANLELSERQAYYPLGFTFAFKDLEGNPTNTALQQDAQEFINFFFGRLEDLLKPTSQKHLLDSVFGGKLCSQSKCPQCGFISNNLESYYNLSVQVKDRRGLDDSLRKMIDSTVISDFRCDKCKQKVDIERRQLIAEPPNVLIVNLQRIIFNFDSFQNDKINTHFEFPSILDLKEYSFRHVMERENHGEQVLQDEQIKHLLDIADDEYVYKLVGITIHRGTAEHGHYYSIINTKRGKLEEDESKPEWKRADKDIWKVFDDQTVRSFDFTDLEKEAFGGSGADNGAGSGITDTDMQAYLFQSGTANSYGQNAYMLVYEKMKKKPIREVILTKPTHKEDKNVEMTEEDSPKPEAALECANSAISRDASVLQEGEFIDPKNQERYRLIPYRKIDPFVPDWIKPRIHEDNNQFLIDRFIFHESFFNLIKGILKHVANNVVTSQHRYNHDYMPWFYKLKECSLRIAGKVMFDMLSYFNINTQMSDITSSLQTIFTFSDSHYSLKRDHSLLKSVIDQYYLADDCKHLLDIMFDCSDKTSRVYMGKLTSSLINKANQVYQDCLDKGTELSDNMSGLKQSADALTLKLVQSLKTQECMKNWTKLEQYLKLLFDVATGGKLQNDLFLSKFEIVSYLLDVILAQVNSKTTTKLNTFEHLVALVAYFTRFSLTPQMRAERHTWNGELNMPPSTLIGYEQWSTDADEKYPIKDSHIDYLIVSDLISMALKEGVQTEQLGKMVAHLCYKNEKLSKKVSKMLLNGISRNDYEKIKSYLDVVTEVALIKDEFQNSRLEWMFGFGSLSSQTATVSITNDANEVLTKVGIKAVNYLSDDAYIFRSALIQDTIDDSLLHLLWRYKGRMDNYTVNCIYSLLLLITKDHAIATFFSELPGPTYCLARYTDWFRPYLQRQQDDDAKYGHAGGCSTQKVEIVVKCLSLIELYEKFLAVKDGTVIEDATGFQIKTVKELQPQCDDVPMEIDEGGEENVKNLIMDSMKREQIGQSSVISQHDNPKEGANQSIIRTKPQPYVIVDCVGERVISEQIYDNVILQISALGCFYTESLPTGDSNLAIPSNVFRNRKQTSFPLRNAGNVQIASNAEKALQNNCINNYFQSSSLVQQTQQASTAGKTRNGMVYPEGEEECMENEPEQEMVYRPIIKDDDAEWEKVAKENNEDQVMTQDDGQVYNDLDDPHRSEENTAYQIKVVEEREGNFGDNTQGIYVGNSNFQSAQPEIEQESGNQASASQDETVSWPFQVDYCEDLVYRFQVTNYRGSQVKCSLSFTPESPQINLFYPKGGFKTVLQAKQTKTILVLHKLRVESEEDFGSEINKLVTHFKFKELAKEGRAAPKNVTVRSITTGLQNAPQMGMLKTTDKDEDLNGSNTAIDLNNSQDDIGSNDMEKILFDPNVAIEIPSSTKGRVSTPKKQKDTAIGEDYQDMNWDAGFDADEKNCEVCTMLNPLYATMCSMCGSPF